MRLWMLWTLKTSTLWLSAAKTSVNGWWTLRFQLNWMPTFKLHGKKWLPTQALKKFQWLCALLLRPKTCQMPLLPANKKPSWTSKVWQTWKKPCTTCSLLCTTTAPSLTVYTKALPTLTWLCLQVCNAWCVLIQVLLVWCLPSTPNLVSTKWCSWLHLTVWAKWSFKARWIQTNSTYTKTTCAKAVLRYCAKWWVLNSSKWSSLKMLLLVNQWKSKTFLKKCVANSRFLKTKSKNWPNTHWRLKSITVARWTSNGAVMASMAKSTSCKPVLKPWNHKKAVKTLCAATASMKKVPCW